MGYYRDGRYPEIDGDCDAHYNYVSNLTLVRPACPDGCKEHLCYQRHHENLWEDAFGRTFESKSSIYDTQWKAVGPIDASWSHATCVASARALILDSMEQKIGSCSGPDYWEAYGSTGLLSDAVVRFNGQVELKVHKIVLCQASPFFKNLFLSQFREEKKLVDVTVPFTHPVDADTLLPVMTHVLKLLYGSARHTIPITEIDETLLTFAETAAYLHIDNLSRDISRFCRTIQHAFMELRVVPPTIYARASHTLSGAP